VFHAITIFNNMLGLQRYVSCTRLLWVRESGYDLHRSHKMDYLFVIFALASMGLLFAGVKKMNRGNGKKFTRLEL